MTQEDIIKLLSAVCVLVVRAERGKSTQDDADAVAALLAAADYNTKAVMAAVIGILEAEDDS